MSNPVVSVICMTYNHALFLEKCLDGFIGQITDFPFEVLIHDDASTDGTQNVIADYQQRYPNLFKVIIQKENQYSRTGYPNPLYNFPRVKGEFVAFCEGDDYWEDANKLQAQVNCMRQNPLCSISYHDSVIEQDGVRRGIKQHRQYRRNSSAHQLLTGFKVSTQTMMIKREVIEIFPVKSFAFGEDKVLTFLAGIVGFGIYLPAVRPSVFRIHAGGVNRGQKSRSLACVNYAKTALQCFELSVKFDQPFSVRMYHFGRLLKSVSMALIGRR